MGLLRERPRRSRPRAAGLGLAVTWRRADPSGRRPARLRRLALRGAFAVLCAVSAGCGGDSEIALDESAASNDFLATRAGGGIAAAGGDAHAVRGDNPCEPSGSATAPPLPIAYIGPDLAELDVVGLESIVMEEPGLVISAYVNEINFNGGIGGRCIEFASYLWSLDNPASDYARICADLPRREPVLYFSLGLWDWDPILECATTEAQIPAVALYASVPEATLARAATRDHALLFIDEGSVERLLTTSLEVAQATGVIDVSDRVALLHGSGPSAGMLSSGAALLRGSAAEHVGTIRIPPEYRDLELLSPEKRIRLLEPYLSAAEREDAGRHRAGLGPEHGELFDRMEEFFTESAGRLKEAGATVVATTTDWTDLRRMMRAAELVDWAPMWVANDIQPATVTLADAPKRQAQNLVQVSSRRAAGDRISERDQDCIALRNTTADAPPFSHRLHTDAWTLITSICDLLDMVFGAMTRTEGPIGPASFATAMGDSRYQTGHGGLVSFAAEAAPGAKRFRLLRADPECVLNSWGCMRSTTGWLEPPLNAQ